MHPILIKLSPLTLHTYGLMVALGFLTGYYVARKEFDRRGLSLEFLDNLILFLMIGGLFGARLFFFLFVTPDAFVTDFWSFFRIWEGGLVYYGGLAAGFAVLVFYTRRREMPLLVALDAFVAPLLIAHALGRLGCFAAGCCYGRPTDSFLGVTFTDPHSLAPLGIPLHPTQLYSSAGNLGLFFAALYLSRKKLKPGALFVFYLIAYGVFRFLIEFVRNDIRGFTAMGLFPSQWVSIGLILVGIGTGLYVRQTE